MSNEILSQLGVGVVIIDTSEKIRYTNSEFLNLFGIDNSTILNQFYKESSFPWIEGQRHLEEKKYPIVEAMRAGQFIQDTVELHLDSDEPMCISHFASPLRNKNKVVIGAIDICVNTGKNELSEKVKNKIYTSLKSFISENTWNHIVTNLKTKSTITAIKQFTTIAFIDIVGFSTTAEKLDAHQTVSMLNIFFNKIYTTITRYKGDVDKFLGDAVLATFFNAEAAVRCFTDILLVDLPIINARLHNFSRDIPELQVHVGINSGWVILGEVGAIKRKELTVIGDSVNTAARIQALTPPNEIWLSSRTVANLGEFKELLTEADQIKVKGKSQQVKVYKFNPSSVKIDSKVFCYEKDASMQANIKEALERKGITSYTIVDTTEKIKTTLTKEHNTMIVGPNTSIKEMMSIKDIIERIGLDSNIMLPISKNVSPESIAALERMGIKTYIPHSEGKQFENSLQNAIRTQEIRKIPPKKSYDESDISPEISEEKEEVLITKEETVNQSINKKESVEDVNLSDAIIYSKETSKIVISIMKVLTIGELKKLSKNLSTIWDFEYQSKKNLNFVFNIDGVRKKGVDKEYIINTINAISKDDKIQRKGWNGSIVFRTKNPELIEFVNTLKDDYPTNVERME